MTEVLNAAVDRLFGDDAPAVLPVLHRTLGHLAVDAGHGRAGGLRRRLQERRARRELTEFLEAAIAVRRTIDGPGIDLLSDLAMRHTDAELCDRVIDMLAAANNGVSRSIRSDRPRSSPRAADGTDSARSDRSASLR